MRGKVFKLTSNVSHPSIHFDPSLVELPEVLFFAAGLVSVVGNIVVGVPQNSMVILLSKNKLVI